jgi:pimeloyl-ACP methyl ester carboxylesterase
MRSETFDLVVGDHHLRVRRLSVGAAPDAPTLVFLHDSLGSIATWRDFPDRVAVRLRLDAVVFDRRGYGESAHFPPAPRTPRYLEDEADSLSGTLAALGVSSAILFGHSDGGSIALIAGALYPDVVRGIVTEGAHVFVEDVTLAGIREARRTLRTTDLRDRLMRYHGDRTDAVTSAWIDTWLSPAYRDWNIESYLPRITCPVLVIQGTDDEYGTEAQVHAIVNGVSGPAQALMIPAVGHTPHREAPDAVLDATVVFVANDVASVRGDASEPRGESAA